MICLEKKIGRINIILRALKMGNDWQILLSGGVEHIGAITLAQPHIPSKPIVIGTHAEGPISQELAEMCANKLNCNIALSSGIHFSNITKAEIETVLSLSREITKDFLNSLNKTV